MKQGPDGPWKGEVMDKWERIGGPELSFEISESDMDLTEIVEMVEKDWPGWKFNRTEPRYNSCVMAIFEKKA